jgi:hypothetical protein
MLAAVCRTAAAARGVLGRTADAAAAAGAAADALASSQEAALTQFQQSFVSDMAREQVRQRLPWRRSGPYLPCPLH